MSNMKNLEIEKQENNALRKKKDHATRAIYLSHKEDNLLKQSGVTISTLIKLCVAISSKEVINKINGMNYKQLNELKNLMSNIDANDSINSFEDIKAEFYDIVGEV